LFSFHGSCFAHIKFLAGLSAFAAAQKAKAANGNLPSLPQSPALHPTFPAGAQGSSSLMSNGPPQRGEMDLTDLFWQVPEILRNEYDSDRASEDDEDDPEPLPSKKINLYEDRKLSNFKKGFIQTQTHTAATVKLRKSGTVCALGQYDLKVTSGEVMIDGARLNPDSPVYRVYAPATHSLPVVECISQTGATVRLHDAVPTMRRLKGISPLFDRIWNFRSRPDTLVRANHPGTHDHRSFSIVRGLDDPPGCENRC
jgi:hypothetical protein